MMFSSKPRVCVLTTSYPDFPGSYRGIFVWRTVHELIKRGYEISVVTPRIFRRSKRFEVNGGERIYRFLFLSEEKLLVEYDRVPIVRMLTYMLSGFLSCLRVIYRDNCQLIHAHFVVPTGLIAVLVGRWMRMPVIIQVHGSDVTKYAKLNRWMAWLTAFASKKADHLIAVSDELAAILTEQFGIQPDKITVSSCGIDVTHFRPMPRNQAREQLNLPEKYSIVLFVGSLIRRKGVDILLSAIARIVAHHSRVKLVVIGEGPLLQQLEAQALDLAIDKIVHFVGRKSNDELPFWYSAADIFVLPSLREGTPLALLEALSCEVPVIVSRAGGMVEVIEDGKNGLLTDIADPVDLEKKLSLLLADSDMRQRFKETARDTVLSWADIQVEIDTILHLYRNLGAAAKSTNRF
jgi:glycosyltransferase involved in cell wall biosynthesis